jgi:hypothetical protein
MSQCLGRTRNLQRCGRIGEWRLFCHEHRWQPAIWVFVFLFTVVAGTASIYSAWWPNASSDVDPSMARMQQRLEGLQTGGDTFAYWMLYYFDMSASVAKDFVIIRQGQYPLYDLRIRIRDMDVGRDVFNTSWGEISAPAEYLPHIRWQLGPSVYYRVFFHARNGQWHQDLILKRSDTAQCWLAATRVFDKHGKKVVFEHIDNSFIGEFGAPDWRQ